MDAAAAREDFLNRVRAYEKVYQTIEDDEDSKQVSYIKLINVGQKIITRNCTGYLPSQVRISYFSFREYVFVFIEL